MPRNYITNMLSSANGASTSPTNTGPASGRGGQANPPGMQTPIAQLLSRMAAPGQTGASGRMTPTPAMMQHLAGQATAQHAAPAVSHPGVPRPGVRPPYPDARSPQPQLMPNGMPVLPTPRPPVGSVPPQMPPSFPPNPGQMLMAQQPTPPTMPPIAQTPMPMAGGSLQLPSLPPGGMAAPPHPLQTPQLARNMHQGQRPLTRRPGMSGLIGR